MTRKFMFTAAAACLAALSFTSCKEEPAFAETEEIGPYTVSLIEKDVWHVEDCNSSNPHGMSRKEDGSMSFNNCSDMYIIRGKDKALLIDLSNKINWAEDADQALRQIFYDRAGSREKLVTITHNHGDHVGMLYAFQDEADVKFLLPENDFANDNNIPAEKKSLIGDLSEINLGGGMTIQTVEVPGHTPGSLVFFIKGHDKAFSGDAFGSGTGVWLFSMEGFLQYTKGIPRLISYIEDPANGIDKDALTFYGGHSWQIGNLERLDYKHLLDQQTLINKIGDGTADREPYQSNMGLLNTNYKYGLATITWNDELGDKYAEMVANGEVK